MSVVLMVAFSALVWSAYRTLAEHRHPAIVAPAPVDGALRLARTRLLQGEISAEDYWRIANVLRS